MYDSSFQQRKHTFFPFHLLEYGEGEMFAWVILVSYPGSFDLSPDGERLIYAPGVYHGKLYEFSQNRSGWELNRIIDGVAPKSHPYKIYTTDAEYQAHADLPGTDIIYYGGGTYRGRVNSFDAGVFYDENGNINHFYGEWSDEKKTLEEGNEFDLSVQILDSKGEIIKSGSVISLSRESRPPLPLVNWKDKEGNFYLLNLKNEVPTVLKFRLKPDDNSIL